MVPKRNMTILEERGIIKKLLPILNVRFKKDIKLLLTR